MTTNKYILNSTKLEELYSIEKPIEYNFSNYDKNLQYNEIKNKIDSYCKKVLDIMMDLRDKSFKNNYVMIKFFDLIPNKPTGNGLWHLDSNILPNERYENFLFCSECECLTEFVDNEILIENKKLNKYEFHRHIENNKSSVIKIKPFTITKYDETRVHRGPIPTKIGKKLLIRLSNTNKTLPIYETK